jgi:hypothetical protein
MLFREMIEAPKPGIQTPELRMFWHRRQLWGIPTRRCAAIRNDP